MGHLELSDLLTARLVCKEFVPMSLLKALHMTWAPDDVDQASSLMLFVSRHCSLPSSPEAHVTIGNFEFEGVAWPGIMLACSCTNLRSFVCTEIELDLSAAQACLRLIPPTLECLEIAAPAELVDDASWARLTSLRSLELLWPEVSAPSALPGKGLAELSSLRKLVFHNVPGADRLLGESFSVGGPMGELKTLTFARNPFRGRPNLLELPALRDIAVPSDEELPGWLEGQDFHTLSLDSRRQLRGVNVARLRCRRLEISHCTGDRPWKISELLEMPCLKALSVKGDRRLSSPVAFTGTEQEYKKLTRLAVDFRPYAELLVKEHGSEKYNVRLRRNGHARICLCAACKDV